jgi:hypothetical protein
VEAVMRAPADDGTDHADSRPRRRLAHREPEAVRRAPTGSRTACIALAVLGILGGQAGLAAAGPIAGAADELDDGDAGLRTRPVRGPGVDAVLAAAYRAAGLDRDPHDGWILRARLAGLVPWLTVRATRDTSWQDEQSEVGHGAGYEVRATWRLDRLLFDSKELQVAAVESARHRERRRLAARVIRAYFTWRRAASLASDDADETDRVAMRVAEAAAELDALTDGWFSAQRSAKPRAAAGSAKP